MGKSVGTRLSNVTGPGDLGLCEVSSEQETIAEVDKSGGHLPLQRTPLSVKVRADYSHANRKENANRPDLMENIRFVASNRTDYVADRCPKAGRFGRLPPEIVPPRPRPAILDATRRVKLAVTTALPPVASKQGFDDR